MYRIILNNEEFARRVRFSTYDMAYEFLADYVGSTWEVSAMLEDGTAIIEEKEKV